MITRDGVRKLLHSNPLGRIIPVDEYLPLMYGSHLNRSLVQMYPHIEPLEALSLRHLLISPTHYVGDAEYISDTEDSDKLSEKNTAVTSEHEESSSSTSDSSNQSLKQSSDPILEPQPPPTSSYFDHLEL